MSDTARISLQREARQATAHEHGWGVESRHATSEGAVVYVRCTACGARRVDLQELPTLPPRALSAEAGGAGARVRSTP